MTLHSPRFASNTRLQGAANNNPAMRQGERGEAVRLLQQALIDLGFSMPISTRRHGSPDGIYGREAAQQVRGFQARQGLAADGVTGRKTLTRLDELLPGTAPALPSLGGNQCFDYNVSGIVPAIAQPSALSCWATVATMLISWRGNRSLTIQTAMDQVGEPYRTYFADGQVLPWAEHDAFARAADMYLESPMCYSVDGFRQMLVGGGSPLFVVVAPAGSDWTTHILAVTGMFGDGSEDRTLIRFIDPDGGRRRILTFRQFVHEYEGAAGRPGLNAQIMHY